MTDPSPEQSQPETADNIPITYTNSVVHRRISVKGSGGVSATVTVTVLQGQVWVSIQPPFTWSAIMEPGKVDELIRTLALARDDVNRMESGECLSRGHKQQLANVRVLPGNKTIGTSSTATT